ncbi:BspA family leucine-rich repeat surface protein [Bifidobacterium sp. ESL0764]|uniref:BspA family leucine-rich repeat surface protein n=1 Tax=Bifidobacterium sp. ESL0764 TaxID=2983228 RepID=UPI0023F96D23|nr:BspA family leucine-rich repeat surface protein [Bifidobacterium sp. ESL0764]WEV66105.1 BspA family leucine-rich repeat surface protein [Bifidobacterium sp. ESL0764]
MRSWNKALIGLLVASAMALGTGAAASADQVSPSAAEGQSSVQEAQNGDAGSDASKLAEANADLKQPASPVQEADKTLSQAGAGDSATQQKTVDKSDQSLKISAAPAAQPKQAPAAQSAQPAQQPQAQSDPSVIDEGDFGGDSNGDHQVHWKLKHEGEEIVLHYGAGIYDLDSYFDPYGCMKHECYGHSDLLNYKNSLTRIVFDDAPHTQLMQDSQHDFSYFGYAFLPALKHIDNIGNVDFSLLAASEPGTTKTVDMYFEYDPQLQDIDLTGWGTSRTVVGQGLAGHNADSKWKTNNEIHTEDMFKGDLSLTTISGLEDWDVTAIDYLSRMFYIDYPGTSSHLSNIGDLSKWDVHNSPRFSSMFAYNPNLTSVGDLSNWKVGQSLSFESMFENTGISDFGDLSHWDVSNAKSMDSMFAVTPVTSMPGIEHWNVSKVVNFDEMFESDENLESLDLSAWKTGSATSMANMFADDDKLAGVGDLSGWDTSKVEWMNGMFKNDRALTSLDLSAWKTPCVQTMKEMFEGDDNLTSLDLTGWDTSKVTDMSYMFLNVSATKIPGIEGWKTPALTNMRYMFLGAYGITSLDLSNFDTHGVTDGKGALPYYLSTLKLGPDAHLQASFFDAATPSEAGATEANGYTGRWTKDDGSWTSEATDDSGSFATHTQEDGFAGTYVWQVFGKVVFLSNAPDGTTAEGTTEDVRVVGPDATKLQAEIPESGYTVNNYTFVGWNSMPDGSGDEFKPGDGLVGFTVPGTTFHLYAQWQKKSSVPTTPIKPVSHVRYVVRYDANAPAGVVPSGSMPDENLNVDVTGGVDYLHYQHSAKANAYSVSGYKFVGWNTKADGSGAQYKAGGSMSLAPGLTTLYAQWSDHASPSPIIRPTKARYAIKYAANAPAGTSAEGKMSDESYTLEKGKNGVTDPTAFNYTLKGSSFTVSGYRFTGWNVQADGKGGSYQKDSVCHLTPGVFTFYAQWEKKGTSDGSKPNPSPSPTPIPTPIPTPNPNPNPNPGNGDGSGNGDNNGNNNNHNANNNHGNAGNNGNGGNNNGNGNNGGAAAPAPLAPRPSVVYRYIPYRVAVGVAPNAVAPVPTPAPGGQQDTTVKATPKQKARPKCMPDDVARRLSTKKKHAKKVAWLEADETAYGTPAAWTDSDYEGLPRCSFASPTTKSVETTQSKGFNWWWLLLLLLVVVAVSTYIYEKNKRNNQESAQHFNGATGEGIEL